MNGTEKAAVKRAIDKGATVAIERNSCATHCSHYNTMTVNAEACYGEELTDFEWASFQSFEQALEEDVKATSRSLGMAMLLQMQALSMVRWPTKSVHSIPLASP